MPTLADTVPSSPAARITLPAGPNAPARARHALRSICGGASVVAELVVSELVTNAVRHSATQPGEPIELEAAVDESTLRIAVIDRGAGFWHDGSPPERGRVGGWGLHMVREVSDAWWIERLDDGRTQVVAELPLTAEFAQADAA